MSGLHTYSHCQQKRATTTEGVRAETGEEDQALVKSGTKLDCKVNRSVPRRCAFRPGPDPGASGLDPRQRQTRPFSNFQQQGDSHTRGILHQHRTMVAGRLIRRSPQHHPGGPRQGSQRRN
ncbi:hypothetical protein BLNAU_23983 [Blattamonas nauphoetae]|uniref:Uncharacterized protein n=1 Tax=Blattamonas nauphoetae TaxID=2049346 RepID=A0ABQ9WPP6_9EUKA|nr:hypothetical protein BLNAU_23983 [Blattamonas nauphoetae]